MNHKTTWPFCIPSHAQFQTFLQQPQTHLPSAETTQQTATSKERTTPILSQPETSSITQTLPSPKTNASLPNRFDNLEATKVVPHLPKTDSGSSPSISLPASKNANLMAKTSAKPSPDNLHPPDQPKKAPKAFDESVQQPRDVLSKQSSPSDNPASPPLEATSSQEHISPLPLPQKQPLTPTESDNLIHKPQGHPESTLQKSSSPDQDQSNGRQPILSSNTRPSRDQGNLIRDQPDRPLSLVDFTSDGNQSSPPYGQNNFVQESQDYPQAPKSSSAESLAESPLDHCQPNLPSSVKDDVRYSSGPPTEFTEQPLPAPDKECLEQPLLDYSPASSSTSDVDLVPEQLDCPDKAKRQPTLSNDKTSHYATELPSSNKDGSVQYLREPHPSEPAEKSESPSSGKGRVLKSSVQSSRVEHPPASPSPSDKFDVHAPSSDENDSAASSDHPIELAEQSLPSPPDKDCLIQSVSQQLPELSPDEDFVQDLSFIPQSQPLPSPPKDAPASKSESRHSKRQPTEPLHKELELPAPDLQPLLPQPCDSDTPTSKPHSHMPEIPTASQQQQQQPQQPKILKPPQHPPTVTELSSTQSVPTQETLKLGGIKNEVILTLSAYLYVFKFLSNTSYANEIFPRTKHIISRPSQMMTEKGLRKYKRH